MYGMVDMEKGEWWVVYGRSLDAPAVAKFMGDRVQALSKRDQLFEEERVAMSIAVRTDAGPVDALALAKQFCDAVPFTVLNGPGKSWFPIAAVHGRESARFFIGDPFPHFDFCARHLVSITGGKFAGGYWFWAVRSDDREAALAKVIPVIANAVAQDEQQREVAPDARHH